MLSLFEFKSNVFCVNYKHFIRWTRREFTTWAKKNSPLRYVKPWQVNTG
ncbi:hypothetical protein TcasGA2_TC033899 [Tribolium castaneum]|uniref:Uncharacterized protein n=1 Tax=Tribolium castaneum TaxID=7070 RepID=A0A139W9E4_TRICA|nr:hypothetical protein TcasGA2_TC033899 [Tribolium castaneum]